MGQLNLAEIISKYENLMFEGVIDLHYHSIPKIGGRIPRDYDQELAVIMKADDFYRLLDELAGIKLNRKPNGSNEP